MLRVVFISILILAIVIDVTAQERVFLPEPIEPGWDIVSFADDSGLGKVGVFHFDFEPDGAIWIAAANGLYYYDGYTWFHYTVEDGLPSNMVRCVLYSSKEELWVGTDRGAGVFYPEDRFFVTNGSESGLAGENVRRISEDPDGTLWFSCDRWLNSSVPCGLSSYRNGIWKKYTVENGLPDNGINNYFRASDGEQYALTQKGVARKSGERWVSVDPQQDQPVWNAVESEAFGVIFSSSESIFTLKDGLWNQLDIPFQSYIKFAILQSGKIVTCSLMNDNEFCFFEWDGDGFQAVSPVFKGLPYAVEYIKQSPDGSVWVVGPKTVVRWNYLGGEWKGFSNLPSPKFSDGDGRIWFTGDGRTVVYGEGQWRELDQYYPMLKKSRDDSVWGISGNTLSNWSQGERIDYPFKENGIREIFNIHFDGQNTVWIIGKGEDEQTRIFSLNGSQWVSFAPAEIQDLTYVASVPDLEGGVWYIMQSPDHRLSLFRFVGEENRKTDLSPEVENLSEPQVFTWHDRDVWLYGRYGLFRYRMETGVWEMIPDMYNRHVYHCLGSTEGLWFVTTGPMGGQGTLLQYNDNQFHRFELDLTRFMSRTPQGNFFATESELIRVNEQTEWKPVPIKLPEDGAVRGIATGSEKDLWVGIGSRVFHFDPVKSEPDTFIENAESEYIQIGTIRFQFRSKERFVPSTSGKTYRFSWSLDSGEWSEYDALNEAVFHADRLAVGKHTLAVKSQDGNLEEDSTPAIAEFVIYPLPLQQQKWFMPFVVSSFLVWLFLILVTYLSRRDLAYYSKNLEEMVTDRTRSLRESQRQLEIAQNVAQVGSWSHDLRTDTLKWSKETQKVFGIHKDEFEPSMELFFSLVHPDDISLINQAYEHFLMSHDHYNIEHRILHEDGSVRWVEENADIAEWEGDVPALVIGTAQDITDRKQAQLEQESLRNLSQSLTGPLNLREISKTVAAESRSLFRHDAFVVNLMSENRSKLIEEYMEDTFDESEGPVEVPQDGMTSFPYPVSAEAKLINRYEAPESTSLVPFGNKERLSRSLMFVPIRWESRVIGDMSVQSYQPGKYSIKDLNLLQAFADQCSGAYARAEADEKQRLLEKQLIQSQKMEAVGRLAGGIAHDFNNLMTVVKGYCDLLMLKLDPEGSMYQSVLEVSNAGERAAALTRQLLAFSRKQIMQPKVVNLNRVVQEMNNMLKRLISEQITIQLRLEGALGNIQADPGQLQQVIMNLVVNAGDAMPSGGKILIETRNVLVDPRSKWMMMDAPPGEYILLKVEDNGTGIAPEIQANIFEPFFTTKEPGKGTGLGLATVYGIVKQSGGFIMLESESNKGTTFKIILPRIESSEMEIKNRQINVTEFRGNETVLVVEDEKGVRSVTRQFLELYGYKVLEAETANEAIAHCSNNNGGIDLLLTDVVMPDMNGPAIAKKIREHYPNICVIYMSGYTQASMFEQLQDEGEVHYIQKPFSPTLLVQSIRKVMDGNEGK